MVYEGTIFRPPSEAGSLLVQVTIGCTWNKCTFCDMYRDKDFRIRSMEEIRADLLEAVPYRDRIRRIFLCDGDALVMPTAQMSELLTEIRMLFPTLEGVRAYASAKNILQKTEEELRSLYELGLDMVYIGLESGSDKVLTLINKGITKSQMIDAAKLLKKTGIKQSISIISGLGGEALMEEHILETADALNQMQPEYVGMLVLHLGNDADMYKALRDGTFRLLSAGQVIEEMRLLLENLRLDDCLFSSAHVSNYVNLNGHLPHDRELMLEALNRLRKI